MLDRERDGLDENVNLTASYADPDEVTDCRNPPVKKAVDRRASGCGLLGCILQLSL